MTYHHHSDSCYGGHYDTVVKEMPQGGYEMWCPWGNYTWWGNTNGQDSWHQTTDCGYQDNELVKILGSDGKLYFSK